MASTIFNDFLLDTSDAAAMERIALSRPLEAMIVLNSSSVSLPLIHLLWNRCGTRLCADGGSNRLHDILLQNGEDPGKYLPDAICGDLDSIRDDVREYYILRGVDLRHYPSQDYNDLDKCLVYLEDKFRRVDLDSVATTTSSQTRQRRVYVLGGGAGRLDQSISCLQALFNWAPRFASGAQADPRLSNGARLLLFGESDCTMLLPPGRHVHHILRDIEGDECGLLPLGGACTVSTTGLQWNLKQQVLSFGGLVSTSNRVLPLAISDGTNSEDSSASIERLHTVDVEIETDAPLVWTCSFGYAQVTATAAAISSAVARTAAPAASTVVSEPL